MASPPTTHGAKGEPESLRNKALETGASMTQNFGPPKRLCAHLNAFHAYAKEPGRCVETNHYCAHLNDDVRQCILYDSPEPNARLIGIEYMITPRLYETLDPDERKLWHSHVFEVKSGMLIMPTPTAVPEKVWEVPENKEMEAVVELYGKVYHLWQTDRGDKLPLGEPQLMTSYTAKEQFDFEKMVGDRDKRFGTDYKQKAKAREYIGEPEIHSDADASWKNAVMAKPMVRIPVIDISTSNHNAATEMLSAAAEYGFVFVENNEAAHMPPKYVNEMFDLSKRFFLSPTELKETCSINSNKSGKNQGWLSMHTETLDPSKQKKGDFKEAFNIGEVRNSAFQQPLPEPLSSNSASVANFAKSCHDLCNRVLQLFALALDIPDDWFTSRHDQSVGPSGSILRLLYYPSVPQSSSPDEDDLPGQPGLEILTPEGAWAGVPVDPSGTLEKEPSKPLPILVNIGDLLAYWTNGLLKSTVHRVIFPKEARRGGEDRYSIAYFCHPLDEAELVSVPSKLVQQHTESEQRVSSGAKTMTARDHLNERLAATYKMNS
ncbi:hypothetical protein MBLNU459_g3228t1 [Dothideomycetes sp. NU459]